MGATKIINVLKDDKFEELLDIVKKSEASEVIFVLPKKSRAFKTEDHFEKLGNEASSNNKSVSFLCSNPEVNEFARKYGFDVLTTKNESAVSKPVKPSKSESIATPVVIKDDDFDDDEDTDDAEEEKSDEYHPSFEKESEEEEEIPAEKTPTEEGEEYKEEEETVIEDEPPFGTNLDDSGNPVYDDEEEKVGEQVASNVSPEGFKITTASTKTRGMSDVVKPGIGKNLRVIQRDKKSVRIETKKEEGLSDLGWNTASSGNLWADVPKPRISKPRFLNKFKLFSGRRLKPKRGLEFNSKNFSKKGVGILSVASVILLLFIVYITVGSARIEIKPRSQDVDTRLKVSISPNFSSVDDSFNRIPGQLFSIDKSASDEFNATAEKDAVQKSRGTITVYNEYSTSPQPLVATTRFEYIQNGKAGFVFRTLQTITVPGMKVENGVVTPGKVSVEVIADKAGQEYNISAGDFGIVAWREKNDTARYEKIYGRSSDSMHGGILGKARVLSEFDYNNAKDQLIAKVERETSEALKSQSAGLELITSNEPEIVSVESTAKIDDAAETFTMTVNGSLTTMGFKKDDMLELISSHIDKTSGLMIVPEKLEITYQDAAINPDNKTLEVVVIIGGKAYAKIDQESIVANLTGKNETQIKDYLGSIKNIESAKVVLRPFWVKKIPKNGEKLKLSLVF